MSNFFDLIPSYLESSVETADLSADSDGLKHQDFELSDDFIESFFGPLPGGIPFWIILLAFYIIFLNIFAIISLFIYFWWFPRRTRNKIPSEPSIANKWFEYAERNLRYNNHSAIKKGYEKTLELDPNNTLALIRYSQYEASLAIQYKPAIMGDPRRLPTNFNAKNAYSRFMKGFKTLGQTQAIFNPLKPVKIEAVYAIAGVLAFDLKNYKDAAKWIALSFKYHELIKQKNGLEKSIELRLNLAASYVKNREIEKAVNQIIFSIKIANKSKLKSHEAQAWELLGEIFFVTKHRKSAEKSFLKAITLDSRRWISARRMYSICKENNRLKEANKYKDLYIRMQKRLSPI
ncbi:MAG: hypothetical protein ACXAC7_13670 [Candidatus Hodarchaeales archaeon]|jgi:tetratricopeptide (TPR) repeat protein